MKRIALTLGEPAGIGADLCVRIAQQSHPFELVVIGSADLLKERAQLLNLPLQLQDFNPSQSPQPTAGTLSLVDIPLREKVIPGTLNAANSPYVIDALKQGYHLCAQKICDALLTLPVHKAIIAQSGIPFMGHTEYFAELAGIPEVLMTFYTPQLIMGLVTTHYALKEVPALITKERLSTAITLLDQGIKQLGHTQGHITEHTTGHTPGHTTGHTSGHKIGILGLNPHAGENGLLGREEIDTIIPVIKKHQQNGLAIVGPLSADTAFSPHTLSEFDGILAMYHDQGLAPLKALYFGQIVNVTLGLPFLRISVDHGTAIDKAGTNAVSTQSLETALTLLARWKNPS